MYKILISVSAFDGMNEYGGHYFSTLVTARELSKEHDVTILVIGDFIPNTLSMADINIAFEPYDTSQCRLSATNIKKLVHGLNPDIVIAFEEKSGSILRFLAASGKLGFIQVKAGGPIPRTPLQNNPFQVHFSKKDFEHATRRIKYKNRLVAWIPNRVDNNFCDWPDIEYLKRKIKIKSDDIVIIRISRIERKYENAFLSAINTARIMRHSGFKVKLLMIGAVSHEDVFNKIHSNASQDDILLTDPWFTRNAKRFLGAAHINLGVGRGFMEGCAAGNHMLAMAGDKNLPVVVTEDNFHELFSENFSLRGHSDFDEERRHFDILDLANKVAQGDVTSKASLAWYGQYFDSSKLSALYRPVLDAAFLYKEKIDFNLIINAALFLAKSVFRRWRGN